MGLFYAQNFETCGLNVSKYILIKKLTLMLFKMPKISFFLRAKAGKEPVLFCRVSLNGTKREFSLKEKISKQDWCIQTQRMIRKSTQKKYVDHLQETISYKLKALAISNENITASTLVEQLKNRGAKKLIEICQDYINNCEASSGTIRNHEIKLKNLQEFSKGVKSDYTPEQFTMLTAAKFIDWFCIKNRTKNITTANRNVLFYKMCCRWYRKKGNSVTSELFNFEADRDRLKAPVFLSADELNVVRTTIFASEYLSRIRDLFVFQCYTGLSYCDLWGEWSLKREDFGTIITGVRGKNEQSFWLPVEDDVVLKLLNKYNNVLPRYENQVYNRMLKEIALICGINKRITTHVARKTFATLMDANGWSRETVSKMLGHSSIKTTELYYLGHSFARLENEYRQRKSAV